MVQVQGILCIMENSSLILYALIGVYGGLDVYASLIA